MSYQLIYYDLIVGYNLNCEIKDSHLKISAFSDPFHRANEHNNLRSIGKKVLIRATIYANKLVI